MQETSMRTAQITRGPEGRRSAFRFVTALLAIGALGAPLSGAQELPKTPIKIITPYAAASSGDIISRVVAERLSQILGQPVIVDLKPGASGILGALAAADAIPDGTTIVQLNDATTSLNPALYENLKYDTTRDFAPLTYAGRIPMVLVVNSRLEVKDVAGLVAMSRDSKRALDFGTGGLGSIQHVLMELFMKANGLAMTHVPYKGISPAVTAAVTGEVSTVIASVAATLPHIKAGRLKPLAVTGLSVHWICRTFRRSPSSVSRASQPSRGLASSLPSKLRLPHWRGCAPHCGNPWTHPLYASDSSPSSKSRPAAQTNSRRLSSVTRSSTRNWSRKSASRPSTSDEPMWRCDAPAPMPAHAWRRERPTIRVRRRRASGSGASSP
jgi:tripartite-type tricarboxylate transporter receptor subunit TctC